MSVIGGGFIERRFSEAVNDRGQQERRYTDLFIVELDDPDTSPSEIMQASFLPSLFDEFDDDPDARLRSKEPSLKDRNSQLVYLVSCEYSTNTPPSNESQDPTNPLDAPVARSVSTTTQEIPATTDRDGDPIVNVLNEQYDPPLSRLRYVDVVTFVKNQPTYSLAFGRAYKGKVNSVAILSEAAGTVLCADISAEEITNNNPPYWRVTYVFHIDPEGWQPNVLEASYQIINGSSGLLIRATNEDGTPTAAPVPIDSNGERTDTPEYTQWNIYPEADFLALNLPFE